MAQKVIQNFNCKNCAFGVRDRIMYSIIYANAQISSFWKKMSLYFFVTRPSRQFRYNEMLTCSRPSSSHLYSIKTACTKFPSTVYVRVWYNLPIRSFVHSFRRLKLSNNSYPLSVFCRTRWSVGQKSLRAKVYVYFSIIQLFFAQWWWWSGR